MLVSQRLSPVFFHRHRHLGGGGRPRGGGADLADLGGAAEGSRRRFRRFAGGRRGNASKMVGKKWH